MTDTSYDRGTAQYTSGTIYTGDTTRTNIVGKTVEVDDYSSPPSLSIAKANGYTTTSMSGGTSQAITYSYDRRGNQTTITAGAPEPGNQTWTTTYNLLGQVVSKTDPDGGTSSMTYDLMGNLQTVTGYTPNIAPVPDGQTQPTTTLYYTYDALGRKTGIYDGDSISAPRLAGYTYDTAGVTDSLGGCRSLRCEASTVGPRSAAQRCHRRLLPPWSTRACRAVRSAPTDLVTGGFAR